MASILPPVPIKDLQEFPQSFQDWLRMLQQVIGGTVGSVPWANVNKAGSNLTDITTRNHNDLQNKQGGSGTEFYHLTSAQDTEAGGILSLGSTGLVARTGSGTASARTITGTANEITVSNGDGVSGNPTLTLSAGLLIANVWTPTLTNTTNITSSTPYAGQYIRVGNNISFSGKVDVTPTGAGLCQLGMSLPIASTFTAQEQCAGCGNSTAGVITPSVSADTVNHRILIQWTSPDNVGKTIHFTGMYQVV